MPSFKASKKKGDQPASESIYKRGIKKLGDKVSEPIASWKAYREARVVASRRRTTRPAGQSARRTPTRQTAPVRRRQVSQSAPVRPASRTPRAPGTPPAAYSRFHAAPGAVERNRQISARWEKAAKHNAVLLLFLVSVFQVLTTVQLLVKGSEHTEDIVWVFGLLIAAEWGFYAFTLLFFRRKTFELEALAFFLSGVGLTVLASTKPEELSTQFTALLIGLVIYTVLVWFMADVERLWLTRYVIGGLVVLLFVINLIFGGGPGGVRHWISVGGMSIQPSELIKIGFLLASVSTLERHQTARNLGAFILFSMFCIGCLVIMKDFGMALIYFATFLIIAFIRSGDVRNIALVTAGAVIGAVIAVTFRPYIADRFKAYGHVWEYADSLGYQQTRTLIYAASGGLLGVGLGNGHLKQVGASRTDLVFGILCEEWGLIFAVLVVMAFCALVFYAMSCAPTARSTFYAITACAASGLLLFQTCLNVFGATDILPLTGVTLPFISQGGSSLMATWGLISFIKAVDGRTYAKRSVAR